MRGAWETPPEPCPYCGAKCEAEFVNVEVGMVQVTPYHCAKCGATEIGLYDEEYELTERERKTGWYGPDPTPDTPDAR